ncbi:MAG: hypothetical protein KBC16_03230 [Candidatus Pacebacteria bacterium]|nr:hypothetical protein [Candidatus Paceibacterota bacterium]
MRGFKLIAVVAVLASTLGACASNNSMRQDFGSVSPDEVPIILPISAGPPTEATYQNHLRYVNRCTYVVEELRGTPLQAGTRRGATSTLSGALGGALGAESWNAVGSGGSMLPGPMAAMYGAINGVMAVPNYAMNWRDQNYSYTFACVRDATVDQLVWYTPSEVRDPASRARIEAEFAAARSASGTLQQGFWPTVPQRD